MKLIVISFLLSICSSLLNSAEFTIEGTGIEEQPTMFSYDSEKLFILWTSKVQNVSSLGIRSVGECGGTIEIIEV